MTNTTEPITKNLMQSINLTEKNFEQAYQRISTNIKTTACIRSAKLSDDFKASVYFKLENQQLTGSFKIRGVMNKILSLENSALKKTLIAASTGNHGAAFAHTISKFSLNGKLFLPENIKQIKLDAIKRYRIPLIFSGMDCVETEAAAAAYCCSENGIFIGPYNDRDIILGQGTIGIELINQLKQIDIIFIPVGGGGLISGIAAYIKTISPDTKIIACQPENSPVMYRSILAGHIIKMNSLPTLADATAGGIEPGSITFDLCRAFVDDFVLLSENEIFSAIKYLYNEENLIVEGGSAMTLAALEKYRDLIKGKQVVLILSGSKLEPSIIKKLGEENG